MKTPYELLNVDADAGDVEIKQAYLRKVKDHPPDRDQEQFQFIHNAFTAIKDINSRISNALFSIPTANFDDLIDQALNTEQTKALNPEHLNQLLRASIDDTTFLKAIANPEK